ncbi:Biotin carboxyl carrier protein of acetyl-CoA carboxylase [bacterium HR39]|nr:Biotin carboxyl carrier protein of acetyl-CoA carboxylase [bacterium HR39]
MSGIDIDPAFLERLAALLERSGLSEIELRQGELHVRLVRRVEVTVVERVVPAAQPVPHQPAPAAAAPEAAPAEEGTTVTAPMVGTVYLQPEPGAPPFVQPGDEVKEGDVLLIIEAMKVMNPIRAPRAGRVLRILVENAQPVEYGEPLVVIG